MLRRRNLPLIAMGLLLPALLYAPALNAPLTAQDDDELFYLAGLTNDSLGCSISTGQMLQAEIYAKGRFRPLFCAERVFLSRYAKRHPRLLRSLPYATVLVSTLVLMSVARSLGLGMFSSVVLAWLVVLNPRGREAWYMLAPQERMGVLFVSVAMLAIIRAVGSRRRWWWDTLAVAASLGTITAKESFVVAVPALLAVRFFVERLRTDHTISRIIRKNLILFCPILLLVALDLGFIRFALQAGGYSSDLLGHTTLAKGLRRVTRHMLSSNAYLLPVLAFWITYFAKRWYRDRAIRTATIAVAITAALWLIPTGAIQVAIGSARGRWIYPLAFAPAMSNAMGFAFLRAKASRLGRMWLDVGIILWLIFCASQCFGGASAFAAGARLTWKTVATINRTVPNNGLVLVTVEAQQQVLMTREIRLLVEGHGRPDIGVYLLDVRTGEVSPTAQRGSGEPLGGRPAPGAIEQTGFAPYDVVIPVPPTPYVPPAIAEQLSAQFRAVDIACPYYPMERDGKWREVAKIRMHLRNKG